jgi:hypothetical protein
VLGTVPLNNAHETAICHNFPDTQFYRRQETLQQSSALKNVTSLLQHIDKPFVYGHGILTGSVFVMQICLTILWDTTNHPLMNKIMGMDQITDHCERRRFTNW